MNGGSAEPNREGRLNKLFRPVRVGRAFGVPLRVHPVTVLVWVLLALSGLAAEGAILFGSVLLHECAHAFVAARRALRVYEVDLLPFGGVARMQPGVWPPVDECAVAVAGPCVNVCLALAAVAAEAGWSAVGGASSPPALIGWSAAANLLLAAFNLLPILPLDGGRMLRTALVGLRGKGMYEATQTVAALSRALAGVVGVVGFLGMWSGLLNVSWVVVALFLYRASAREQTAAAVALLKRAARPRRRLNGRGVRSIRAFALSAETSLGAALRVVRRGADVIVVIDEDGLILGTLLEGDVWDAAARLGLSAPVAQVLRD